MTLTAIAFVVSYVFGLVRAFVSHPRWGLYTYLGAFYLHPPSRWWGVGLPDLRWSLIAAIVTLLALPSAKLPPSTTPWFAHTITKVLVAYVAWMWVQTAWGNPNHFEGVILMTKYVILYYIIYRLVLDERGLLGFAAAHVAGCFYFGLLAFGAEGSGRLEFIGGPGVDDSNTLGMHLGTGMLFAATLILSQRGWRRWAVLLTIPFIANAIVQTESRGAFLGAACGGLVYFIFAPKVYRKTLLTLGALGICVLLAYAPAVYWERMQTLKAVQSDEVEIDRSAESRFVIIEAQWRMFLDHPQGLGFNTTGYLSPLYLDVQWLTADAGQDRAVFGARSSHNTIMSVVTDQGVPGIILMVIAAFAIFSMMRTLKKIEATAANRTVALMGASICGSLICVFVSGLFTDYIKAEVQLWCIALLVASLEIARQHQIAPGDEARPA